MTDEPVDDAGEQKVSTADLQQPTTEDTVGSNVPSPQEGEFRVPPRKFNHQAFMKRQDGRKGQAASLLLWGDPDIVPPDREQYDGMIRYIGAVLERGELPNRTYTFSVANFLLWAYWSEWDLPEEYKEAAKGHGIRATRFIVEDWLPREVWPLVEAVNLARGFPRQFIGIHFDCDECIAPDLYDLVETLLNQKGLGILRSDAKLDVRRDDFLRIMLEKRFWLPPPLRAAAKSLKKQAKNVEAPKGNNGIVDVSIPTADNEILNLFRHLAMYHQFMRPDAFRKDVCNSVLAYMLSVGVRKNWSGLKKPETLKYGLLKGLGSSPHKRGPKPRDVAQKKSPDQRDPNLEGKSARKKPPKG